MKKILIIFIVISILMLGGGGLAVWLLSKGGDEVDQFDNRRHLQQSDQEDAHAFRYDTDSASVELKREGEDKNVLNFDETSAFSIRHTKESRDRLNRLIRRQNPSFEKPLIAYNPFGTMPNTYYFYFKTQQNCMVRYTVTVEDEKISDHIRYVYNGETKNMTNVHEFVVGGLIPGMTNYIIMELLDENGSHREDITYKVSVPPSTAPTSLQHERGKSDWRLTNGLFFYMPKKDKRIYLYDNCGILRGIAETESAHGGRVYANDSHVIYQISGTKVVRINKLGEIEGMASFTGIREILDFAYDDYENVFALIRIGKQYGIVRTSMDGGATKPVYTFDKKVHPTSLSAVVGGDLYVSCDEPVGVMRVSGLLSSRPKVSLVAGLKNDWKKTKYKKKVVDPTQPKKKKKTEESDEKKKEDAEVASGDAAEATEKPEEKKDPPFVGWDMESSKLYLVRDESNGKTDTLAFAVKKDRLIHAVKLQIAVKKKDKDVELLFDKETEFDGQVFVQWIDREHSVIGNGTRGTYEERDEAFKVTREFTGESEFDGLWKYSLEGMCFYP